MSCSKTVFGLQERKHKRINVWQTLIKFCRENPESFAEKLSESFAGKVSESFAAWSWVSADGGCVLKGNPWPQVLRSSFKAEAPPRPLAGNYLDKDWLIEGLPFVIKVASKKGVFTEVTSFVPLWQELKRLVDCTNPTFNYSSITWHMVPCHSKKQCK